MKMSERMDIAKWAMKKVLEYGGDEASVSLYNSRKIEIDVRDGELEKLKESTENSLSLDVYTDNKYSGHSTNNLDKNELDKFIKEAVASTKYLTKDEYRSLPDPKFYPKDMNEDLELYDEAYKNVTSTERLEKAKEIEEIAKAQSDNIISVTSGYSDNLYESILVHSNGFEGSRKGTSFSAGCEVTVRDGEKGRPSDWNWFTVIYHKDMPNAEEVAKKAVFLAERKIGQEKIDSGKYTMIVDNRTAGRILGLFQSPMTARALQQKNSFLEGKIGEQIASDKLTMIDDPFIKKGLGSRFYDGDGLATKKRTFIEKGVLKEYFIDNYYGKKIGMEPTIGSPSNIVLEYGDNDLDAIIKNSDKAIYVTGFIGGNSNSTTGDFSFGIVGQLVEGGKIIKPINEMNISGNTMDIWSKLTEVGNDPYPYSSWRMPTLVFADVDFSGK